MHLHRLNRRNPIQTFPHEISVGGPEYEVMEIACNTEYEEIDTTLRGCSEPHPPKGEYELTQCAAYGPVARQ